MPSVEDRWFVEREDANGDTIKVPTARHGTGKRWRARYRDPNGKSRSPVFEKKGDAERFLTRIESSKLAGSYVDPKQSARTFKDVAEAWWTVHSPNFADSTRTLWRRYLDRYIYPRLGSYPVGRIKKSTVDAAMTGWRQTLGPRTVRHTLTLTRRILNSAVEDGLIAANPAAAVRPPKAPVRREVHLSDDDVKVIIGDAPDAYRWLVVALTGLGLRISEACGLRVEDVDFLRRVVRVRQQLRPDGTYGKLKTDESPRDIPADDEVLAALAEQIRLYPRTDGLVFSSAFGRHLTRAAAGHVFAKVAEDSGIAVSPHSLRHYFGASLLTRGVNVVAVSRWLGHSTPTVTLSVYAYLMKNDEETGRAAMKSVMGAVLGSGSRVPHVSHASRDPGGTDAAAASVETPAAPVEAVPSGA